MGSLHYSCSGEVEYWSLAPWCHSGRGAEWVLLASFHIMAEWEFVCERSLFLDDRGRLILTWGYVTYQMIPIQHQIVYKKNTGTLTYTHTYTGRMVERFSMHILSGKYARKMQKTHISMNTIRRKKHTQAENVQNLQDLLHTHAHTHWYYFSLLVHEWASRLAKRSSECITNH